MTKILYSKPIKSSMALKTKFSIHDGNLHLDPMTYHTTVNAFQYATFSCLILACKVNNLSKFMSKPINVY